MKVNQTTSLIVKWIKAYSNQANQKSLIVGVSGGIDSALTSTLCAMTNIKTFLLSMPIHQKKTELKNAQKHMKWLTKNYNNLQIISIDLTKAFESYKTSIPLEYQSDLALANTRARLRMVTLYQVAATKNGLVVGTGNKVEDFGVGFFTKYGDGGVDISPIGDLNKSEVRSLARFCGINKSIIAAAPTDGLWEDGRSDESQIGATYEELEWAMNSKEKALSTRQKTVMHIYRDLHKKNKHKMVPIPICIIPKKFKINPE